MYSYCLRHVLVLLASCTRTAYLVIKRQDVLHFDVTEAALGGSEVGQCVTREHFAMVLLDAVEQLVDDTCKNDRHALLIRT